MNFIPHTMNKNIPVFMTGLNFMSEHFASNTEAILKC